VIGKRYQANIRHRGNLQVSIIRSKAGEAPTGKYRVKATVQFGLPADTPKNAAGPAAPVKEAGRLGKTGNVAGVITIDGAPVAEGEVLLVPAERLNEKGVAASTDKDGTFEMLEIAVGKYKVVINGKDVPEKYKNALQTPIIYEVLKGDNIGSFTLKK